MCHLYLVFFFSSRRRHTRYIGDWSSDVCSSDLHTSRGSALSSRRRRDQLLISGVSCPDQNRSRRREAADRSEERRVGKECRSRWGPDEEKKRKQDKAGEGDER